MTKTAKHAPGNELNKQEDELKTWAEYFKEPPDATVIKKVQFMGIRLLIRQVLFWKRKDIGFRNEKDRKHPEEIRRTTIIAARFSLE